MAESRTYLQYLPLVDRVDYLGGFFTSYAYCDAVEHLANIQVSKRAQYISRREQLSCLGIIGSFQQVLVEV